jgi:hypothetical protein
MNKFVLSAATAAVCAFVGASNSSAQTATPFFTDFESGADGFVATGDWELGTPVGFDAAEFGGPEPVGGHSGDFVFGTVIGGEHNASTDSLLSQTFDLTDSTDTVLTFFSWNISGGNAFDQASVLVNGAEEFLLDGFSDVDGDGEADWELVTVDLSAYDGLPNVDVAFSFSTTGVVNRVGWYVDDVSVAPIPEPATAGLLAFAGLTLLRRRR